MASRVVAGVDWAGDGWLAVVFRDRSYAGCVLSDDFEGIFETEPNCDLIIVDVPIGLPDDEETLSHREEVDSLVRSVTGKPSSVFPVPSRGACNDAAREGTNYEEVAEQNQSDIGKGLTKQSYHFAAGIGEVDALLLENEQARSVVVESHPELCFRGFLGHQLRHSKDSAAGVGERLDSLRKHIQNPGLLIEEITYDLVGISDEVELDDVIDAVVLGVVGWRGKRELRYLPENWNTDSKGLPMRMAYRAEESLSVI